MQQMSLQTSMFTPSAIAPPSVCIGRGDMTELTFVKSGLPQPLPTTWASFTNLRFGHAVKGILMSEYAFGNMA